MVKEIEHIVPTIIPLKRKLEAKKIKFIMRNEKGEVGEINPEINLDKDYEQIGCGIALSLDLETQEDFAHYAENWFAEYGEKPEIGDAITISARVWVLSPYGWVCVY